MKIFGFEITRPKKPQEVEDQVPEVRVVIPDTKKPTAIPRQKDPTLMYHAERRSGRGSFQTPEYDLSEVGRIEDTDSYVRQAFDKKVALMFKEGWDLVGKNPRTIKYIKARLAQICQASGIPTEQLFRMIGSALVRKSNAFIVKARKTEASGGRVRREPGSITDIKPVAGYFIAPAETMEFRLSGHRLQRWRQKMPDGETKEWNPKDVIHFHYSKKEGFVFGTPLIIPIVDDIRALRKIEENIELLVYQHLFPLFQYKVGTDDAPAGITEAGEREIDVVKREIQFMPTEGGIVTPERHEIKAIGAEGRALRAEQYLDHFKKRVFSGLGVSAVDMGEGETANRATADNMSRNLIDAVKDYQQVMEIFVNEYVLKELLLESTFGDSVLDDENLVRLKFKEIDVDAQIKKEAHAADQFTKDILTWDEARRRVGEEPIVIPTPEEVEAGTDSADNFPEWHKTRWKVFEEPKLLIQSIDEPYSPAAKAAAANNSVGMTEAGNEEVAQKQNQQEVELEKERTKAKVAVAKAKPAPKPTTKKDGFLETTFVQVKKDIVKHVSETQRLDPNWVASLIRTQMGTTIDRLISQQLIEFRNGYSQWGSVESEQFAVATGSARLLLRERAERYITRLTENIISSLKRNVKADSENIAATTRAVFEAVQFRARFIEDVEVRKAKNLGIAYAARDKGGFGFMSFVHAPDGHEPCAKCMSKNGIEVNLGFVTLDDVPPHHANCGCTFGQSQLVLDFKDSVQDGSVDKPEEGDIPKSEYTDCPKCGKTAIRKKDTPDIYNCRACKTAFRKAQEVMISGTPDEQDEMPGPILQNSVQDEGPGSNRAQYRRCVSKFKAALKARDPEMDDAEVTARAEAACYTLLDTADDVEENLEDGTLEECVLSVKKSLRKQHPDWSEDKIKSSAFAICNSRMKGKK